MFLLSELVVIATEEVVARITKAAPVKRRSFAFKLSDLILFHLGDHD